MQNFKIIVEGKIMKQIDRFPGQFFVQGGQSARCPMLDTPLDLFM